MWYNITFKHNDVTQHLLLQFAYCPFVRLLPKAEQLRLDEPQNAIR